MNSIIDFLRLAGFTDAEIMQAGLLVAAGLIVASYKTYCGRFFRYTVNGVEVIKDRKLGKEYVVYKGKKLN